MNLPAMKRRPLLDLLLLVSILTLAGWYLFAKVDLQAVPAEDAAILMRYAQHLGEGQGIVWNIGEAPVDGATDFLFMVLLGGLHALGVSLEAGVRGLGIAAHLLTLIAVYRGALKVSGGQRWAAWLSAAFLAVGPGLRYVEAGFGTPFFALFAALTWLAALSASERPASKGRAFLFALCSLLTGLIRPEGVLVGAFIMLAVLVRIGFKASRRILAVYLGLNLLLGGAYFLWRWNYFGYPLPNPFYKKGGGLFYGGSLELSFNNVVKMAGPFWLACVYGAIVWLFLGLRVLARPAAACARFFLSAAGKSGGARSAARAFRAFSVLCLAVLVIGLARTSSSIHEVLILGRYSASYFALLLVLLAAALIALALGNRLAHSGADDIKRFGAWLQTLPDGFAGADLGSHARQALFLLIPTVGYILMWGLLSDEMNYLGRFQYAIIPIMLISWPGFFSGFRSAWGDSIHFAFQPAVRVLAGLALAALALTALANQYNDYLLSYQKDGRYDMALRLRGYAGRGYTIAATEAGLLPLYSDWRALDAWGLNDAWITHRGGIDAAYIDQYKPEVIMFHADFSPLAPPSDGPVEGAWQKMVMTLKNYADDHHYELAAVFGTNPHDTHYYYVKPGFADSEAIVADIRAMEDEGYYFGARSLNLIYYPRNEDAR